MYKLYRISWEEDAALIEQNKDCQILYKFVGFAYLLLNLGPYMIDLSQTNYELLVSKSLQKLNWNRKSLTNQICIRIIISPLGLMIIIVKKFLRLL